MIKQSELLNEIYYGNGIKYSQDESNSNGSYYQADYLHLSEMGIETVEDIKRLTRECFTVSLTNSIINSKLTSISDESGIQNYARYYQKYNALDNSEECIMVYKDAVVYLTDKIEYDYSSIRVCGVKKEEVFVEISVTVSTEDEKTQTKKIEIALLEENEGWRINSPTYTKYVDRDYYNELQNKK